MGWAVGTVWGSCALVLVKTVKIFGQCFRVHIHVKIVMCKPETDHPRTQCSCRYEFHLWKFEEVPPEQLDILGELSTVYYLFLVD